MKKSFYHRFSDFIEGKGFYIVLALCLVAIGISGWFLFSSLSRIVAMSFCEPRS